MIQCDPSFKSTVASEAAKLFSPRCLSIDLEVRRHDARIQRFAAVRCDTGQSLVYARGDLADALSQLDAFAEGLTFLLGHNLVAFDLPHLAAAKPDLQILTWPAVDTLRLNPLAFPRNPYHHLVKHYQHGQLQRGRWNDPELDARLTLDVFRDQRDALATLNQSSPEQLLAWHWLTTLGASDAGVNSFFATIRRAPRPPDKQAVTVIQHWLAERGCPTQVEAIIPKIGEYGWALAYAMAWLSVAGGDSVMPPWVRYQFPLARELVHRLRDTPCNRVSDCVWCSQHHNARSELKRWFGFDGFRPEPADGAGQPLQQTIVEAAMRGESLLGILPTGTGKSLCYQIPSLSRYDKTGALTVVISPLVALMADQVQGLEARGIDACAALNGLLSMPERSDVLDRVRLGNIGILIVSPEQLRNRAFRNVLSQREIGAWVLDEAHCLSKWGHDFRPDYRYVGRFIKERAGEYALPPVSCLTATAKPDVVQDICGYFHDQLGVDLKLFDGGSQRTNLTFLAVPMIPGNKFAQLFELLQQYLPAEIPGGAIIYCAKRKYTEEIVEFLREKMIEADYFHAGLPPEAKKSVQQRFIHGDLRVIVATNAFGMGIDKPDVRLVIHADVPGSLENYMQEAGRAGRDREQAYCVLLYSSDAVEQQFGMSARSRLTRREIQAILRSVRRLQVKRCEGEVIATAGEILAEDDEGIFERDSATDDTRVRTALAWLEESALLSREENRVQVFPSSLRVATVDEARKRLDKAKVTQTYRQQLLALIDSLMTADADEGISTDELMGCSGLNAQGVRRALYDLERLGIASNDTVLTAFVHVGVQRNSRKRYEETAALEIALLDHLREAGADLGKGDTSVLQLRRATQRLKDAGHHHALPEKLWRIVKSIAADGRDEEGGRGSLGIRRLDPENIRVVLQRDWEALQKTAVLRREAAGLLLQHLVAAVPEGKRGNDILAATTLGQLTAVLQNDVALSSQIKDIPKLLDRALLWLHEQEVIRLNKGLAVFRPAMTIHLSPERHQFRKADFIPLETHYAQQVLQIHVMAEYAQRALEVIADALRLAMDYFRLSHETFVQKWLPGRDKGLLLQTTPESWRSIVECLNHREQQKIVADDREQSNVLVLAGPGSGKTRVLVHRIAYLVRVRRENPRGIVALAYNRHAAVDIRRRLVGLIGDDARGVTVLTCHALAMRLVGASFAERATAEGDVFKEVLQQAVALLQSDDLLPEEADAQRERLLSGFRWILVDEYQDIAAEQYALISALAGRTLRDEDRRLSLFAVGDDDQNIYAFNGASVEFIRRFEADYSARPIYLTDNYRSSAHIISAANQVIESSSTRLKTEHPITVDHVRRKHPLGGEWEQLDPVSRGRVQILHTEPDRYSQALAVMTELQRLATLDTDWCWSRVAVIAREWQYLDPVRGYCEQQDIDVQMADEQAPPLWRLRETRFLLDWLKMQSPGLMDIARTTAWLDQQPDSPWWALLRQALEEYRLETANADCLTKHFTEWLAEWGREVRRQQQGLMLLSAHRAKGLEFDHVAVLDGGWTRIGNNEDADAPRRLYYVAMTRARHTLTLARLGQQLPFLDTLSDASAWLWRPAVQHAALDPALRRCYRRLQLQDVDLGFAGRYPPSHSIHAAIAHLKPGDVLQLRDQGGRRELLNALGRVIGRLSKGCRLPAGMHCAHAQVAAIVVRYQQDAQPQYRDSVRCERWEVVLPELVFIPPVNAPNQPP